jgi:hypothetical protein
MRRFPKPLSVYPPYGVVRRTTAAISALAALLALSSCGSGSTTTTEPATTNAATTATGTQTSTSDKPGNEGKPSSGKDQSIDPASALSPSFVTQSVLELRPLDAACSGLVTPSYLQKAYGGAEGCRAAYHGGGGAESVDVVHKQVAGTHATIVAIPSGGPSDGERLRVELVQSDGVWRVAAIHSNVPVGP